MPKPLLHFLSYGRGLYQPVVCEKRDRPQPLCDEREFVQTQLTSNERRVTCPRCLAILHAPMPNMGGVPEEGAVEHLKNAAAIIQANLELGEQDALVADDARAVLARIKAALRQLENKRVDIALPNRRRRGSVRRGNPSLMVLGANPRVEDATIATWAKIEYRRPDDPDGKDVIRVHEFKDGFEIGWLDDGSVQLSHPRHPLWTEDEIGRA